ncbi:PREDICTED: CCACVL1_23607 [Prunus dulcis]|uniref:PREDICTED: CCACVL1_23607 n=1 Tax=Prunus dulcis TaxID=3755 RepID=A0A5E4EBJ3_PRUDU|nr:uncharacterized protein LOC117619490 [Prunus dulcis]VVA12289.1 PREDICTED: CCACVL1_23607 [Prunus dulcis]
MVAQETYQNPTVLEEKTEQFQDQDPYEAEETLSLCDLPTHSDSAHWDDCSKEYQSSSFDNDEDNFFEFFSEEFTASTYPSSGKDIIFCGKLIPCKEAPKSFEAEKTHHQDKEIGSTKRIRKGFFRSWRSCSFHKTSKSFNSKISKPALQGKDPRSMNTCLSFPTSKSYRKCELSKVSILSSTPSKSKWYLFMFGMARFPTEMELRDIRTRQSRRSPSTMFRSFDEGSDQMEGQKGNMGRKSSNKAKGLWGLLRAVGCRISQPNTVVKAGFL